MDLTRRRSEMDRPRGRRSFLGRLAILGLASPFLAACAQAPRRSRLRRIGFINGDIPSLTAAFRDELRRLGYTEGEDIEIEMRLLSGAPGELSTEPPQTTLTGS